jgi:hypothetical protein
MNRQNKDYLEKDFEKHQPKLFMPILNTIIAVAAIVLMIRVAITNKVHIIWLIVFILLMIVFAGGSWYSSFILKRQNKKATVDFQKETELLFSAVYELKKGTYIEPKTPVYFEINKDYKPIEKVTYTKISRAFLPKLDHEILINLGPTCSGLNVDFNTLDVVGFSGCAPYSIWRPKKLTLPEFTEGSLKLKMDGFNKVNKLTLKILNQVDSYFDKKSGIFAIGDIRKTALDDNIKIGENVIVSLYENHVKCVYVILESNLLSK